MDQSPVLDSSCISTQPLKSSNQKPSQNLEITKDVSSPSPKNITQEKNNPLEALQRCNHTTIRHDSEFQHAQNYFGEDGDDLTEANEQEIADRVKSCERNSNPYELYFKPAVFAKAFASHALFFLCLGPLIILLAPIFGINTLRNQGFFGYRVTFFSQTFQYLIIFAFLLILYTVDIIGLHAIEVYMMVIAVVVRIIIISSKYAYQSTEYVKLFNKKAFTTQELNHKAMVGPWHRQTDEIVRQEFQTAILRLEIDSSLFFFNFLGKVSPELQSKLEKLRPVQTQTQPNLSIMDLSHRENSPCSKKKNETIFNGDETIPGKTELAVDGESPLRNRIGTEGDSEAGSKRKIQIETISDAPMRRKSERESPLKRAFGRFSNYLNVIGKKRSTQIHADDKSLNTAFSHFFQAKKLERNNLSSYSLAITLMDYSRCHRFVHLDKLIILVSLVRALLPTFYRLYVIKHQKENIALFTSQPVVVVLLFLINTYFFYVNTFVLAVAVCDIRAKICNFKQIGYLISPRKISYFVNRKLYPTLNIFDPITLKTWVNLRRVMYEYGKEYRLRNNLNISLVMAAYSFIVCIIILQLFGIVNTYDDPLLLLVLGYESVVYFTIFIQVMIGTAFINDQYTVHKYLLTKNKSIIADFHRLSHIYAGKDAIIPDNFIYREGLRVLKEELGEDNFKEKVVERAETLIMMIDDAIGELEFEEINEPFTVMGIAINYTVLKGALIGITSVLFGLIQASIKKNAK